MHTLHRSNLFYRMLIICFILGSLLINTIIAALDIAIPHWLRMIIQYALLFGLPIAYFMKKTTLMPHDIGFQAPAHPLSDIACAIILAICLQPVLTLIASLSALLFHNNVNDTMETIIQEPFLLSVSGSAILPALCEETAFRGVFLSGYTDGRERPAVSCWTACLFCGIAFAGIHVNFQQIPYAFCSGFILAMMAIQSGSILPPVITHALINLIQIIMAYTGWNPFGNTVVLVVSAVIGCGVMLGVWAVKRPKEIPHGRYMIRMRWKEPQMRPFWQAIIIALICAALFS